MEEEIASLLEAPSDYYPDLISKDDHVCVTLFSHPQDLTELYEDDPVERAAHLSYQKRVTIVFFYGAAVAALLGGIIVSLGLQGQDTGTVQYCDRATGVCHSNSNNTNSPAPPTGTIMGASIAISLLCVLLGYFADGIFFVAPPEPFFDPDQLLFRIEKVNSNRDSCCCFQDEEAPVRRRYHLPRMLLDDNDSTTTTVCTSTELAEIVWFLVDPISEFLLQDENDHFFSLFPTTTTTSLSLQAKQAKLDQLVAEQCPQFHLQIQRVRVKEQKTHWQYTIAITADLSKQNNMDIMNDTASECDNDNDHHRPSDSASSLLLLGGLLHGVTHHMNRLSDEIINREEGVALVEV